MADVELSNGTPGKQLCQQISVTNMTKLRGRARRGERLIDMSPHGHWKTSTLIAALGIDGVRCSTVVDGAVNADIF